MIGRREEYARAMSLFSHVENLPFLLFIKGGIGLGKTLFVEEILKNYKEKFQIIENRLFEYAVEPYSYFIQVILQLKELHPELADEVKCFHEVTELLKGENNNLEISESVIKNAIKESILYSSNKNPLILVFEDFHLADATSIELIPSLFEGFPGSPFSIVLTYKNESVAHQKNFKKLRALMRGTKACYEIELFPFSQEETGMYIEKLINAPLEGSLIKTLYEHTQGNPFFIGELVKTLQQNQLLINTSHGYKTVNQEAIPIPDTIKDMVALQLENLSEESRDLLEIAAIVGNEFEFETISQLAPNPYAIDELLEKELISEVKPGIGTFKHKLVQEAVNQEILWSKRRTISRMLAETFHKNNRNPELEGSYWLAAGERENARKAFVKAAKKYCFLHAHWDAAHIANKALELWNKNEDEEERVEILLELARCTQISGQLSETIKALREAVESPVLKEEFERKGEIYRSLAATQALQGTWNKYLEYRLKASENYELAGNFGEAVIDLIDLSNRKIDTLEIEESLKFADKAIHNAEKSGDKKLYSKSLSIKGYALSILGRTREAVETANKAMSIAESINDNEASAYAYRKLAGVFEFSSEFKESIKLYESALSFCKREDLDVQAVFCISCMSWVLFRLGDWKRASEMCLEVINDTDTNDASRSTAHGVLSLIRAYRGEIKSAKSHIKASTQLAKKANFKLIQFFQHWAAGVVEENDNNFKEAHYQYKKVIDDWYEIRDVHDSISGMFSSATFFYENGHQNDLNECLRIMNLIVNATGNIEAVACLSFMNGLTSLMSQNYPQAKDHLENALTNFSDISVPLQVIVVEYFLSITLVILEERDKALKLLKKIIQDSKNLGMRPFAQKVKSYLQNEFAETAGERRNEDHEERKEQGGLTNRQMEILTGLSDGLSNKEIAAKLFLSTRTVDMHVRNLFDHLNCRSRTEAVKVAKEKGILA